MRNTDSTRKAIRPDRRLTGVLALGLLLAVPVALRAAPPQGSDGHWLPYLGCWHPVSDMGVANAICLSPTADGLGVEIARVEENKVTSRNVLIADGLQHDMQDAGCKGWQRARWSNDGFRLFLHSEAICEGGVRRTATGLMAMTSEDGWMDVELVEANGQQSTVIRRYEPGEPGLASKVGVTGVPAGKALAVSTARLAASAPLSLGQVVEASQAVPSEVVQAALVERGAQFNLDSQALTQLADAGVPPDVIDVMVALSYPDRFAIDRNNFSGEYRPATPAEATEAPFYPTRRGYYDPFGYDPFGWYYGISPWSYYNPYWYSPFGYGGVYWGVPGGSPVVIVPQGQAEPHGRMVKGRGYTRNLGGTSSGSSVNSGRRATVRSPGPIRSSVGSSGRSATSRGSMSSGSGRSTSRGSTSRSTGRTAKRRGSG